MLAQHKWHAAVTPKGRAYAARRVRDKMLLMHRVILGCDPGQITDHANGDGLDNRRANLRPCSHTENNRNKVHKRTARESRFKGVRLSRSRMRWRATICIGNRQMIALGAYATEAEAALAYDRAALHYFGEFAWLNFPEIREAA